MIDDAGQQLGIMPPPQALILARQKGLDLVEISPTAVPPVCRIMDYGKYQYQEQKRAREAKRHQKVIEVKEIKFRPKVDEHDYQFKKHHIERFIAILLEHVAGAFPLWLAPLQTIVLPIADRHLDYAREVVKVLEEAGLRAEVDDRQEKVNYKIREAQLQKIPYMLVVGDREASDRAVAVRSQKKGDLGARPLDQFLTDALAEVRAKALS